ncbi:uncharacterized protein TNCT_81611 [Trichonephila clavata]|uniref:Uncharacterized protein n=1 Tax=Trichonephila clavata TaxID=2740835 RepID=A0A8X6JZN0_TRICU|nr:uncharacterized protein TNCT_81611 [Trichonephila clavata]
MKLNSMVSPRNQTPVKDEALEDFHNLHSDIETDELSLSEAEDIMSEKSSSSENTYIDEEVDDISVPGPSHISKVTGKNKASVKIRHLPFTEQSGPSDETTSLQDPSLISIFLTLFSISFLKQFVPNKCYAKRSIHSCYCTGYVFFSIYVVMGIKRLPSY